MTLIPLGQTSWIFFYLGALQMFEESQVNLKRKVEMEEIYEIKI